MGRSVRGMAASSGGRGGMEEEEEERRDGSEWNGMEWKGFGWGIERFGNREAGFLGLKRLENSSRHGGW